MGAARAIRLCDSSLPPGKWLFHIIYEVGHKWDLLRVFRHLQNTLSEELSLEEAFWLSYGQCAVVLRVAERVARVYAACIGISQRVHSVDLFYFITVLSPIIPEKGHALFEQVVEYVSAFVVEFKKFDVRVHR